MRFSLRSRLGWCGASAVAVATIAAAVALSVGSGESASAGFRARALGAARAALAHMSAPNKPAPLAGRHPAATAGVTQLGSYNWSGYADTSSTANEFTAVSGSWTVPGVACTSEHRDQMNWVGLDGATTTTVEQIGTLAQCFEGKATYYTWYEMYPAQASSMLVGTTAKPGDKISASVVRTGTSYTMKLTDATTSGNNIKTTQTCTSCLNESAEWIIERPYYSTTGYTPLAQFKSTGFGAGAETAGGVKGTMLTSSTNEYSMIDSTDTYDLATPSALSSTHGAFSVTWNNSY